MANVSEGLIVAEESQRALSSMNDSLRKVYERIRSKLVQAAKDDIMSRYDIGLMIKETVSDEKKYDACAAAKLASALGISESVLSNHQQVASTWGRDELEKLVAQQSKGTGFCLTWIHLCYLSSVTSPDKRHELAVTCLKESMTSRDLLARIQALAGRKGNNPKGRKHTVPRSPVAGLQKLSKMTGSLVNAQTVFDEAIFDRIIERPQEYATEEVLAALQEAQEEQALLEAAARSNCAKLRSAIDTLSRAGQLDDDEDEEVETVGDEFLPRRKAAAVRSEVEIRAAAAAVKAKAAMKLRKPTTV